jgi:hypothetical protein
MGILNIFRKNSQPKPYPGMAQQGMRFPPPPMDYSQDIPGIPTFPEMPNLQGNQQNAPQPELPSLPELDIPVPPPELYSKPQNPVLSPKDVVASFSDGRRAAGEKSQSIPDIPIEMPKLETIPEMPKLQTMQEPALSDDEIMPPPPPIEGKPVSGLEIPLPPGKETGNVEAKSIKESFKEAIMEKFASPQAEKPRLERGGSIFVNVDDYREILNSTSTIRSSLGEAEDIVSRLNELKNEKDKEFDKWRLKLEDVERKLIFIDKTVFEANS